MNVRTTIDASPAATGDRLAEYLFSHAPEAEMSTTLRAPFRLGSVTVTLERDVRVRITPLGSERGAYAVAWMPEASGPFPAFAGTLMIGGDATAELTLDGHYHPPLGVAGDVFDAVVGRHIARACAIDFLARLTTALTSPELSRTPSLA